jgi:hypothetical protein
MLDSTAPGKCQGDDENGAVRGAGRQIPGEQTRPIDITVLRQIREANICGWCFEPLGASRAEFNGGIGHLACVMFAHHAVLGDEDGPAPPWLPGIARWRVDPDHLFLERLGKAATRHGINRKRLVRAISEAFDG